jgi:hypothetical protein
MQAAREDRDWSAAGVVGRVGDQLNYSFSLGTKPEGHFRAGEQRPASLELPVRPAGKDVHGTAVGIVGGIGQKLIIERQSRRTC